MSHISGANTPNAGPLMYSERPDWVDVVPIPQFEGVNPIAPIFYTPEYKDATDYFRGVVKTGERSQRVLELTETIIRMNPAHYSAWQYRYRTLLALRSPLDKELKLMDGIAKQFLKTYQVWHHRRLLITLLAAPPSPSSSSSASPAKDMDAGADSLDLATSELEFIARVLEVDAKNYHTWSYRQWLLAHFDDARLWLGELPYTDDLLAADVRNNSAWHHRFFILFGRGARAGASAEEAEELLRREIRFTKDKIALAPNNASAWNYLRGVLDSTHTPFNALAPFAALYAAPAPPAPAPEGVVDLDNCPPAADAVLPCVAALDFLAEARVREGGAGVQAAVETWRSLANVHDTMRKKYWEYRIKEALAGNAASK